MPQISCIMPVYNSEAYLNQTIKSLLNQTFSDFELILVDDASQDTSLEICSKFQRSDDRIQIIKNKQNLGAAKSRNLGLEIAKGKYVIFLDADDFFYPEMFEICFQTAELREADLIVFGYEMLEKVLQSQTSSQYRKINGKKYFLKELESEKVDFHAVYCADLVPWNKFVRRELLLQNGIKFQDIPNANDMKYAVMVVLSARRIIFLDRIFVQYVKWKKSSLSEFTCKSKSYCVSALAEIYEFVCKNHANGLFDSIAGLNFVLEVFQKYIYSNKFLMNVKQEIYHDIFVHQALWEALIKNRHNPNLFPHNQKLIGCLMQRENLLEENRYVCYMEGYQNIYRKGKRIGLWGCGLLGKEFLDALEIANLKIDYVIDKDPKKQNTYYKSYRIWNYEDIKEKVDIVLILNPEFYEEITKDAKGTELVDISQL